MIKQQFHAEQSPREKLLQLLFYKISNIQDEVYNFDYPMHADIKEVYHKLNEARELMRKVK